MSALILSALLLRGGGPSGAEILQRVQKAYDSVRTLEQDVRGDISGSVGTAHISFVRPGKLRVSGQSMFRSPYDLVVNGRETWVLNGGRWSQVQNPEMGVATITGLSANAGAAVPATLLHTSFGSFSGLGRTKLTVSRSKANGRAAYCLQGASPFPIKIYVDAQSYLFLRTEASVMNRKITVVFGTPKINAAIPASRFRR